MYFNASEAYNKAIKERDNVGLKALLVGIIGADPTFATTEFDEALKYIKDKSVEYNGEELVLDEDYKVQEGEYQSTEWDEDYYKMKLVWLQDNFAIKERLLEIEKTGEKVFADKNTFGKLKYR